MSGHANRRVPPSTGVQKPLTGLPDGVVALAGKLLGEHPLPIEAGPQPSAAAVDTAHSTERLSALLFAPKQLDRGWPSPIEPVPVGDGWLHTELLDEDRPLFAALLEQHGRSGPEAVAARCQEARLPVCPYRAYDRASDRPANPDSTGNVRGGDNTRGNGDGSVVEGLAGKMPGRDGGVDQNDGNVVNGAFDDVVVVDLTTHWAGPLATKLLADAGATVIKVDPRCRPDGFGDRPSVYEHLNGKKQIVDLDLRSENGRQAFEALIRRADLVVESFSRRVMANLDYRPAQLRQLRPSLSTVSIKAFPANTPEADWLAYGPGVHAAAGLAATDQLPGEQSARPIPTPIAYPDFLTGIAAYAASASLLSGSQRTSAPVNGQTEPTGTDVEVAMANVIMPLQPAVTPGFATAGPTGIRGLDG